LNVAVQTKQLNAQLEQEVQKRSSLQSELKTAQGQITQLKAAEKQLIKVLIALLLAFTSLQHVSWAMGRTSGL